MSVTASRVLALGILGRIRRDDAWLGSVLPQALERSGLKDPDRAFVTRLLNGTVSYCGVLDDLIDRVASHPSRLEPRVRDALRLSTYELMFMDTPARAAVNEGVELVRSVTPRAAGMANAVLRGIDRTRADFPFGEPASDISALARLTGHPLWLTRLLVDEHGLEPASAMLHANNESAPLYVAQNPFLSEFDDLVDRLKDSGAEPVPRSVPGSIECMCPQQAVRSAALAAGDGIVADLVPQAIISMCPTTQIARVVDVAAGRGTKTVLLQAHMHRHTIAAQVEAFDLHSSKVSALERRTSALAVPRVTATQIDATDPSALRAAVSSADLVFVDAPCSGLGTLRRHPEKRWSLKPQRIAELARLATSMLETAASVVRPGGFVVYSTCTVTHAENDQVVATFLDRSGGDFATETLADRVPVDMRDWITPEGWFQSLPVAKGPDGHFAALLRKAE